MRLPISVAAVIFKQTPAGTRYLVLHRVPSRGGFWQPVTGGLETSDASLLDCLWRELREELRLQRSDVAAVIPDVHTRQFPMEHADFGRELMVTEHYFGVELLPGATITLSEEHDELRWVPLDEASVLLRWDGNKDGMRKLQALLPVAQKAKPL